MSVGRFLSGVSCAVLLWFPLSTLAAQGVTTGAVAGIATDTEGAPLASATIVATHLPSGTQYRAITRASGAYTLPNLRVGGPYRIVATLLG